MLTCEDPGIPANGHMVTSYEFNIGSTATFSCSHGYMLTGADHGRRCNEFGNWTGAQPLCIRKIFRVYCSNYYCLIFSPVYVFFVFVCMNVCLGTRLPLYNPVNYPKINMKFNVGFYICGTDF